MRYFWLILILILINTPILLALDENVKPIAYYPSAEGDYQQFQTTGETKILGQVAIGDPTGISITGDKLWVKEGGVETSGVTKTEGGLVVLNGSGRDNDSNPGEMWVDPS